MAPISNRNTRRPVPRPQALAPKPVAAQSRARGAPASTAKPGARGWKPKENAAVPERLARRGGAMRGAARNLENDLNAKVTRNRDGSTTRSQTSNRGRETQELTSRRSVRGSEVRYQSTSTADNRLGLQTGRKDSFTAKSDVLGRVSSSQTRELSQSSNGVTQTRSRTEAQDILGGRQTTARESTETANGRTTRGSARSVTTDDRGNRQSTFERSIRNEAPGRTARGQASVTVGSQSTGTSPSGFSGGTFSASNSRDHKTQVAAQASGSVEFGTARDDKGFSQKRDDKLSRAQTVANVVAGAGPKIDLVPNSSFRNEVSSPNLSSDPNSFVGARASVSGSQNLTAGLNGVTGNFNREATAGVYANTRGGNEQLGYDARAQVEARASLTATGKLDSNGLTLSGGARVGVRAEVGASAHANTASVNVAGVPVNAGVRGSATASAEVSAEATGRVGITRNPPTVVAEGTVGASAVAKAEAQMRAHAGPFAVTASAYASAGAEAKATGAVGYENGKLRLSGSVGAALGLGAGGSVGVEVDVNQIGQMAQNTGRAVAAQVAQKADLNGDGKLDLGDARAAASTVVSGAQRAAHQAVDNAANAVRGWLRL